MWQRTAFIIVLVMALTTWTRSLGMQRPCPALLISDLNWVHFDVVMGRVLATSHRTKKDRQNARRELPCGGSETLMVTIDDGLISLHYRYLGKDQELSISVIRRDEMTVRWVSDGADNRPAIVSYSQVPGCPVTLTVDQPDQDRCVLSGPSLWHLVLLDPEPCVEHLTKLLLPLRPDWQIAREAAQLRVVLLGRPPSLQSTSRREVAMLVDDLTNDEFRVRQRATRKLCARGRSALCFLDELDDRQLEIEQRLRIRAIRQEILSENNDTPARVAAWLVNDKSTWLALLNERSPVDRDTAQGHLTRLCGQSIDFDATASGEIRSAQVAELRAKLLR